MKACYIRSLISSPNPGTGGTVEIREANLEDCAGLARVQVDSYRTSYADVFPRAYLDQFSYEEQEADWREVLADPGKQKLLVAINDEGEIAGYALGQYGLTEFGPYGGELRAIHVRRPDQRLGIGRLLSRAMARTLRDLGCRAMLVWVLEESPARSFYVQLGGRLIGRKTISLGDAYHFSTQELAYGWTNIDTLAELEVSE